MIELHLRIEEQNDGIWRVEDDRGQQIGLGETPCAAIIDYSNAVWDNIRFLSWHERSLRGESLTELYAYRDFVTGSSGAV